MKIIPGQSVAASAEPIVVVVCVNLRIGPMAVSCGGADSEAIADALEAGIRRRQINAKVERIRCLGLCSQGPNVRFVPGGSWFNQVAPGDAEAILDHLETT